MNILGKNINTYRSPAYYILIAGLFVLLCLPILASYAQSGGGGGGGGGSGGGSGGSGGGSGGGANICHCCGGGCASGPHATTRGRVSSEHNSTRNHFGFTFPIYMGIGQLGSYQIWFKTHILEERLIPKFKMITEQMSVTMMQQVAAIGSFMDAQNQIETQHLYNRLKAQAHKDYHPSVGMCMFGTNVRSLAASQQEGAFTSSVMSQIFQDRQLGKVNSNAAGGSSMDRRGRMTTFREKFCDRKDLNPIERNSKVDNEDVTGLFICSSDPREGDKGTVNADIDFTRNIMLPRTVNINFSDSVSNIKAADGSYSEMSNYLYGHDVFDLKGRNAMASEGLDEYQDARAIIAKRSVAQNTFNSLIALKARGSGDNADGSGSSEDTGRYMKAILSELGVNKDDNANAYFAGSNAMGSNYAGMSYYAQMEILSKKIYQRPEFYTNLYDTPANVQRKSVAMKAIGLMLERDIYESHLRSEALLSMLLEARLTPLQDKLIRDMGLLR